MALGLHYCGVIAIVAVSIALNFGTANEESKTLVLELTEKNYDEVINNTPLIMVEFYAPW